MSITKRNILLVVLIVFSMVALSACGGPAPSDGDSTTPGDGSGNATSEYRTEINIAIETDAETYIPVLWRNTTANRIGQLVYDGLVYLDEQVLPQPALATSWENPDETTWIFHLREGVKFHDGRDFTAADVKYTYEQILNPEINPPYINRYTSIESIDIIDPYTVQFNLNKPFAPILVYLDLGIMPEGALDEPNFATNPIGTGVYKMTSYTLNGVTKLAAFEDYWGEKAATQNINFHIIGDMSMRFAAVQSGDIDLIVSPVVATELPIAESDSKLTVHRTPSLGITYMGLSVTNPILSDLKVRQAIAHMVNKETISKNIYNGMDTPADTPLQSISWAYDSSLHDYDYDKDAAIALLEEAGWVDTNNDGIREKDGQQLAITIATHTDDTSRFEVVEYMQNALTGIGMKVDVSVSEWALFSADMMAGKLDVWVAGWLNLFDPDRMYDMFHSSSPSAYGGYNNPRVDELLEQARASSDNEVRAKAYQEAAQIVTDEVFYVTLVDQTFVAIHNSKLDGFVAYPTAGFYPLRYCTMLK